MASFQYHKFAFDYPEWVDTDLFNLKLPFSVQKQSPIRLLLVVEHVSTEDLEIGKLLGGATGDMWNTILTRACKRIGLSRTDITWACVNFNDWKTYGETAQYVSQSSHHFLERVHKFAARFKPTHTIVFGRSATKLLLPKAQEKGYTEYNIFGIPFSTKIGGVKTILTSTIPLHLPVEDDSAKGHGPSNLIGYMIRNVANALSGRNLFKVSLPDFKCVTINTIEKFDKLLKFLKRAPVISIDTETDSLNRKVVVMHTVQFYAGGDKAYFLPFIHKDSPWNKKELQYIANRLAHFFETSDSRYHIYHHGKFDLAVLKANTGCRYYKAPIWDTMHAEFQLDENVGKYLTMFYNCLPSPKSSLYGGYYTLANLSSQYSCWAWHDLEFGKDDRATITERDLDKPLKIYGCTDVVVPWFIHEQQKLRAKAENYAAYQKTVLGLESDKVHAFAEMEYNGIPTESQYMRYLAGPQSPIKNRIAEIEESIIKSPEARSVNKKLIAENGVPQMTLFAEESQKFSIDCKAHMQRLLFEECGLKPLEVGANGTGSLNKAFKTAYAKHHLVTQFDEIEKVKKLRDSFVTPFVRRLDESGDMAFDQRIRPFLNAVYVVTGRISESDPNMQQIPNRGMGKLIKRMFVAPPGAIYIKTDYVAHEVRGWSLISGDEVLGDVFRHGLNLRLKYRIKPSTKLAELIFLEGDSHRLNVAYFFNIDLKKIDREKLDELRGQIKGIVFGLIYGMADKTLAKNMNKNLNEITDLIAKMFARFKAGAKWLKQVEADGKERLFVEAPTGRRRHLWSYLVPESAEHARMLWGAANRKARNSPIQGMCSDFNFTSCRNLQRKNFEYMKRVGEQRFWLMNVVHDSKESMSTIRGMWWAIDNIQRSMTEDAEKICGNRYGFKFAVPLEVDMEIGPCYSAMNKWDWSATSLASGLARSFVFQQEELGYDIKPLTELRWLFESKDAKADMPFWFRKQLQNNGVPDLKAILRTAREEFKPSAYRKLILDDTLELEVA